MLVIIILYVLFVTVDAYRLHNSSMYTKPLVILDEKIVDDTVVYTGIGYIIIYEEEKNVTQKGDTTYIEMTGKSAEFKWLGITIWDWWQ